MDVGCGYNAQFLRYIQKTYHPAHAIAYDLALNKDFLTKTGVECIEGDLNAPFVLHRQADLIFATAILEHLHQPVAFLKQCFAALAPGGSLVLTTPSIWSQPVLELLAYRLHIISEEEIRDHKDYYDKAKLLDYFQQA
ncbi:MAG: methyltransferase domain-containing protein [bacterium]|nr:methyltransferase domain-containing protein [bacterium]